MKNKIFLCIFIIFTFIYSAYAPDSFYEYHRGTYSKYHYYTFEQLKEEEKKGVKDYELFWYIAIDYADQEQTDKAIEYVQKAYDLCQDNEEKGKLLSVLSGIYYESYQFDKAIEACEKALKLLTTSFNKSRVYNKLGRIYEQKKDYEMARYYYQKSLDTDVNEFSYEPYCGLGCILVKEGKYRKAIPLLKKSIEINDKDYKSQYVIGYCYNRLKKIDLSHKHYMNALNLLENPKNKIQKDWLASVNIGLAELYLYSKDKEFLSYSKALEYAKKATENPENIEYASYWRVLADAYYKNNQYEQAIGAIKKAIEMDPKDEKYKENLKKYEDALKNIKK